MKHIKNWNWKQIGWRVLQALIILILNTASFVYIIGSNVPYETINKNGIEFRLSWIDYLKLSDRVEWYHIFLIWLFIIIGIVLTIFFIKLLWKNKQANKDRELENKKYELETKKLEAQEKAHKELSDRIEKIMRGK